MKNKTIKGFKGFDKGMKCMGMQFKENETFQVDGDPKVCSSGMHFCENPLDVFTYYPPIIGAEYAEVESAGAVDRELDKVCTNKLLVKSKLSVGSMFKLGFEMLWSKIKADKSDTSTTGRESHSSTTGEEAHSSTTGNYAHSSTTGDYAHSSTTGYKAHSSTTGRESHSTTTGNNAHSSTTGNYAHSSTTGDYAHSSTTGEEAHSSTTGNYAHSSTTGDYAHSSTTGYKAHSSTTGYKAHSSTNGYNAHSSTTGYKAHSSTTGNYAHSSTTGEESISTSLGFNGRAKSTKGWIIIVDWRIDNNGNRYINDIYRAKVGEQDVMGILIEPDTWYWFENGKLKSEKTI